MVPHYSNFSKQAESCNEAENAWQKYTLPTNSGLVTLQPILSTKSSPESMANHSPRPLPRTGV